MEIAKTKKFDRTDYKTQVAIPVAKEREALYPFQWLLFKPQLHAVEPFTLNEATRNGNTQRDDLRGRRVNESNGRPQ
jgi:hypothetical protein